MARTHRGRVSVITYYCVYSTCVRRCTGILALAKLALCVIVLMQGQTMASSLSLSLSLAFSLS